MPSGRALCIGGPLNERIIEGDPLLPILRAPIVPKMSTICEFALEDPTAQTIQVAEYELMIRRGGAEAYDRYYYRLRNG